MHLIHLKWALFTCLLSLLTACMSEEAPPGTAGEDTAYLPESKKPIAVLSEDSSEAAKYIARAETFLQVGRAQEAISVLETCLELFDPGSTPLDPKWLRAKLNLMRALVAKNRIVEAQQVMTEMRPLIGKEDTRFKAAFEAAVGALFLKTQTFDSAAYYLDHSLGIYESGAVSDTAGHVRALVSRGFLYCRQGQFEKGLESGEKALSLAKAKFGTFHPETATVYNLLAFASSELSEFNNAVKYGRVTNDIYRRFEVDPMLRVAGLINLANYYSRTGALDEAVEGFDSARALIVRYAASARDTMLLGNVFYSLGTAELLRKNYESSNHYFRQAIDFWLPGFGAGHPAIASCYSYLGVNYAVLRDFDNARRYTRKAISIDTRNPQIGWHYTDVATMYVDLAGIEQKAGFHDRAFALLDTAFFCLRYEPDAPDFYRNAVSAPTLLKAFIQQGEFLFDKYRRQSDTSVLSEALAVYDRALRVADYIQSDYRDPASIEFLSELTYLLTEGALRAFLAARERHLQPNLTARIFNLFERNKDFLILKSLSENAFFERLEVADPAFREEGRLKKKISDLELTRQALSPEESKERRASLNIQIGELTARYNQLRKKNRVQHPVLDQILAPKTLSVQEVRARFLTAPRDAFLEYFVGDSSVFAFLILPDTLQILEMKKDFPIEARVREMRTGIYGYFDPESNLTYKNAARQYAAAAAELYDKIFKPLEPFLPRQTRLTIVPDGALGYIPFEALLEKMPENPLDFRSHAPLIRSHTISYACSAGLLWEMKTQKLDEAPLPKVLAFAPSFGDDWKKLAENRGVNVNLRGNQLGPLKNNIPEIRAIKSQFAADLYEGAAATEARFRALAGKYSILHLATHGVANDRMGDFSFLAFHEIKDDLENEWLYNREIYDLRLNADLVVLSACETGVGVFKRGEGVISLARGFSYAGAKSLVTSLWKVDDAGTKNLMEIFYRNLRNGQPKDEALRAAKLELIENPNKDYAPPFFWAAFIAIGDMRPLSAGN